jgi:signal peptidase
VSSSRADPVTVPTPTSAATTPTTVTRRAGSWWRAVASAAALALVAALAVALWPAAWGGSTSLTIVQGHSMEPTYATGDLVVGRTGPAQVGDVVVYRPTGLNGHVVHRVVGGDATDGWVVRGDNNTWDDPWRPTGDEVVGVVRWHVPHAGRVIGALTSPTAWLAYAVIAAGWLLWPGREAEDDDTGSAGGQPDDRPDRQPQQEVPRELTHT